MHAKQRRTGVIDLRLRQPFVTTARRYYDAGLYPVPLPTKAKTPPPTGYTGWKNDFSKATQKKLDEWLGSTKYKNGNVAIWLAPGLLGIDVDAYKEAGAESLAAIEKDLGPLPETWIVTARADGVSGIRFYRVPDHIGWPGKLGGGIETIHVGHRYAVVAPSIHPELSAEAGEPVPYLWYAPGQIPDGSGSLDVPDADDFAELPDEWVEYLSKARFSRVLKEKKLGPPSVATKKVDAWIAKHDGEPCSAMVRVLDEVIEDFEGSSAHDTARDGFYRLACLAAEAHPGLATVASRLEDEFRAEVERDGRDGTARGVGEARGEWLRLRDMGVKKVMFREDHGDFIGSQCNCTGLTAEGKPKPRIDVNDYYLPTALELCYAAVAPSSASKGYGMYHSGGILRELTKHGARDATIATLRGQVSRSVDWYRYAGGEEPRPVPTLPPRDFLSTMLEDASVRDALPELRGNTRTPFWALVDGKPALINQNGYHPGAKVFLAMDPDMEHVVSETRLDPSPRYVARAVELIEEVLWDFPFKTEPDKANAYAALLMPFCRDLIVGPTPIHLIDAPTPGTGKGLLVDAIGLITCGALEEKEGFAKIAVPDDRNRNVELVKEINARMRDTPKLVLLDNINNVLDSGSLASAITTSTYQARILGVSQSFETPNRALWVATANNIQVSEEIMRRIAWSRLDAHVERPEERTGFRHPDLLAYVRKERPGLVWACLTLIANWVANGGQPGRVKLGGFEAWSSTLSGVLEAAGIKGLLGNRKEFKKRAADEAATLDGLIEEWADFFKDKLVAPAELLVLDAASDLVPEDLKARDRKLGTILSNAEDKVINGFAIRKRNPGNRKRYFLEPIAGGVKGRRRRRRLPKDGNPGGR